MDWLRRLGRNRLLDVGVAGIALLALVRLVVLVSGPTDRGDFAHYYIASRLLLEGGDPYVTELGPLHAQYGFTPPPLDHMTAPNLPPFLFLMAPLAMLPSRAAYWGWTLLEAAAFGVVLWLSWRLLAERLSRRGRLFVLAGALASAPVYWHFFYAQIGMLLAALLMIGFQWHRDGRPLLACGAVTVAGLLKVFPFVLLPWFIWRGAGSWRERWRRVLVVGVVVTVMVLATGWGRWVSFGEHSLTRVAEQSVNQSFNFTVPSFLINLRLAAADFLLPASAAQGWVQFGTGIGLAMIAGVYWVCWRWPGAADVEFSLLCMVMLAGSIRAWGHYFVILIFPVAVAVSCVARRPTIGRIGWVAGSLFLLNLMGTVASPWWTQHLVWKVFVNYLPLYGLLMLGGWLVVEHFDIANE